MALILVRSWLYKLDFPASRKGLKSMDSDSTVQYSTIQYNTVQYSTAQYSTVQYSTVQYSYLNTVSGADPGAWQVKEAECPEGRGPGVGGEMEALRGGTGVYCTVLYCTVLYCTVLYCTVLYCTVLYINVLYCNVLYIT